MKVDVKKDHYLFLLLSETFLTTKFSNLKASEELELFPTFLIDEKFVFIFATKSELVESSPLFGDLFGEFSHKFAPLFLR